MPLIRTKSTDELLKNPFAVDLFIKLEQLLKKYCVEEKQICIPIHEFKKLIESVDADILLKRDPNINDISLLNVLTYVKYENKNEFAQLLKIIFNSNSQSKVVDALVRPCLFMNDKMPIVYYITIKGRGTYLEYVISFIASLSNKADKDRVNDMILNSLHCIQKNKNRLKVPVENFITLCELLIKILSADQAFITSVNLSKEIICKLKEVTTKDWHKRKNYTAYSPAKKIKREPRLFHPSLFTPLEESNPDFFDLNYKKLTLKQYLEETKPFLKKGESEQLPLSEAGKTQAGLWAEALVFKNEIYRYLKKYGKHYSKNQIEILAEKIKNNENTQLDLIHPTKGFLQMRWVWPNQNLFQQAYIAAIKEKVAVVSSAPFDIKVVKKFYTQDKPSEKIIEVKSTRAALNQYQRSSIRFSEQECRQMCQKTAKYRLYFVTGTEAIADQIHISQITDIDTILPSDNSIAIKELKVRL